MKKFEKPVVLCFTKSDLEKHAKASTTCPQVFCSQGTSYTCGPSISYSGVKTNERCIKGNSFTCGKTNNHIGKIEEGV
ncbi:unknown [Coprobacillus sp. CAG:698]|nr:unknown [Coprobacillus sp. CAG:698]